MITMEISLEASSSSTTATEFQEGSIVSGTLHLCATKDTAARELCLYFKGKEYTTVGNHRDQHSIVRLPVPCWLPSDHGRVPAGTHALPFRLGLPTGIPPSLRVSSSRGAETARIAYHMRAVLVGSGRIQDHSTQQEITVVPSTKPPQQRPEDVHAVPVVHSIPSSSDTAGEVTCGIHVWDPRLAPGQRPQVSLAIVNDSTVTISHLEFSLEQEVFWWAAGRKTPFHSTGTTQIVIAPTVDHPTIAAAKLDSVAAVTRRLQDPSRAHVNQQRIRQQLTIHPHPNEDTAGVYTLPPVPTTTTSQLPGQRLLLASFQGQKMGVAHRIRLTMVTDNHHRLTQVVPVTIGAGGPGK